MVRQNPPDVIKKRVKHAKERLERLDTTNKIATKALRDIVNFWEDKENFSKYCEFYSKPTAAYSFDLDWSHINYNYKSDLSDKIMELLVGSQDAVPQKTSFQDPLFRIYRQLDSQIEKRQVL